MAAESKGEVAKNMPAEVTVDEKGEARTVECREKGGKLKGLEGDL